MRTSVLLIIATLAMIAWFVSALELERKQAQVHGASMSKADLQMCIPLRPPAPRPLIRHKQEGGAIRPSSGGIA